ncbi:MAG: hypothetical protein R3D00_04250 [Bacteroidia bacterium]
MNTSDEYYLRLLKSQVESFLGWGSSPTWTSRDFTELSERILETTGVNLSATTLKRIWGRVNYQSAPSTQTLDTLAAYIGHDNWRVFRNSFPPTDHLPAPEPEYSFRRPVFAILKPFVWFGGMGIFLLAALLLWLNVSSTPKRLPDPVKSPGFFSSPVAKGIPNTVIFHYDLSCFTADSFSIQQSWDDRRRERIDPGNFTHTSVYYTPGYFRAKILANDQVLAEHDVYVPSDGWMAFIDRFPQPQYLAVSEHEHSFSVDKQQLAEAENRYPDEIPSLCYILVEDFGEVFSDDFELETNMKMEKPFRNAVCGRMSMVVMCSEGRIVIPFSVPGCVGELKIRCGETEIDGKSHDLSALGIPVEEWNLIGLKVKDRQAEIWVNGQPVYHFPAQNFPGKIIGLRYRFEGEGTIRGVKLTGREAVAIYPMPGT